MRPFPFLAAALLTALLAACAGDGTSGDQPSSSSGSAGMGPGLSVSEARRSRLDGPLLVNGYVVAEGSKVRLCETLATPSSPADPPQCGGASLDVRGLDPASIPGVQSSGAVRWSTQPRHLLGEVTNGVLTVSGSSQG